MSHPRNAGVRSKAQSPAWRDVAIKPLGLTLYDSRGAMGFHSYVEQVYEVDQVSEAKGQIEFRKITRHGDAVYLDKHPGLYTAFKVGSVVFPELVAACRDIDAEMLSQVDAYATIHKGKSTPEAAEPDASHKAGQP